MKDSRKKQLDRRSIRTHILSTSVFPEASLANVNTIYFDKTDENYD